jgi:heme-degrading monooxygenase HmoA
MMTIVTHITIQPGREPAWDAAFRERLDDARKQPGWVAAQLCIPAESPNQRVIIGTWETRAHWEAWHATEPFQKTRQEMEAAQADVIGEWWHEVVIQESRDGSRASR